MKHLTILTYLLKVITPDAALCHAVMGHAWKKLKREITERWPAHCMAQPNTSVIAPFVSIV